MQRLVTLVTVMVMALSALSGAARAAEPDPARARAGALVDEGLKLARAKRFRQAVDKFAEANRLYPHPEIQHNLARAYEELGELRHAYYWFSQALKQDYTYASEGRARMEAIEAKLLERYARLTVRTTPSDVRVTLQLPDGQEEVFITSPFEAWVPAGQVKLTGTNPEFKTGTLELELAAGERRAVTLVLQPLPKQGFVVVQGNVPGAQVFLNEVLVGTLPMDSITHPVGVYDVKVVADGYAPFRAQVVINPDEVTTVTAALEPEGGAPPPGAGDEATSGGPPTWAGATLVSVGAAGVIAAVVLHVEAFRTNDDANAIPISDPPNPVDEARYDKLYTQARDLQRYALFTYIGAGALIGAGAVLLVLADDAPEAPPADGTAGVTVAPEVRLTPELIGAGATIRF